MLTEINELKSSSNKEKVGRLEVRVDDAALVDDRHSVQHLGPVVLDHGLGDLLGVHVLLEEAGQVGVALLHHHVQHVEVVVFFKVVEPDDPVLALQLAQKVDFV